MLCAQINDSVERFEIFNGICGNGNNERKINHCINCGKQKRKPRRICGTAKNNDCSRNNNINHRVKRNRQNYIFLKRLRLEIEQPCHFFEKRKNLLCCNINSVENPKGKKMLVEFFVAVNIACKRCCEQEKRYPNCQTCRHKGECDKNKSVFNKEHQIYCACDYSAGESNLNFKRNPVNKPKFNSAVFPFSAGDLVVIKRRSYRQNNHQHINQTEQINIVVYFLCKIIKIAIGCEIVCAVLIN